MEEIYNLWKAKEEILRDAIHRDIATARRATLLDILWSERYLNRRQLIARSEMLLGKGCFGEKAWEDNFFRDMRVVKRAFQRAGYELVFNRNGPHAGYFLVGQPAVSPEFSEGIRYAIAEVDQRQIEIYRQLSPADRFHQASVLSETARKVVAYRIKQENPEISDLEANRRALQRSYR
jgi:hypothetical protein